MARRDAGTGSAFVRKDGRVTIRWVDEDGRTRYRVRKGWTLTRARAELREILDRIHGGDRTAEGLPMAAFLADVWLPVYEAQVSADTLARGAPQFDRIGAFFGLVRDIDRGAVARYVKHLRELGLSDATIRRELNLLAPALDEAVELGHLRRNPLRGPRHRKVRLAPARPREIGEVTPAQIEDVLSRVSEQYRDVVRLLAETGFRRGQGLALRWDGVDLERGTVTAPFAQKGGRVQTVPMLDGVRALLERRAAGRRSGEPRVFPGLTANGLRLHWTRVRDAEGFPVPGLRLHDLRKVYATHAAALGASHATVAALLGHRTVRTTEGHYLGAQPSELAAAGEALRRFRRSSGRVRGSRRTSDDRSDAPG